jgi:SIR2-like domain
VNDSDWTMLLSRIDDGRCTPFLGAGAATPALPLGSEIARAWADAHNYPLDDPGDLARVAQFLGVDDAMWPKEQIIRRLRECNPPDFNKADEPHTVLAKLPLPVYMTTNYDDFMVTALKQQRKVPQRDICRWNKTDSMKAEPKVLTGRFKPEPATPIVFHLHGHLGVPESLVLTEDDYLAFLVAVTREPDLLPHQIRKAFSDTTLLFVGYSLRDWNFRVLHRGIVMEMDDALRRFSVTVQVEDDDLPNPAAAREYLDRYFGNMKVRVYWGTAQEFMTELWQRWEGFTDDKGKRNGGG